MRCDLPDAPASDLRRTPPREASGAILKVTLDDEARRHLSALVAHWGVSQPDVVRTLLASAFKAITREDDDPTDTSARALLDEAAQ